MNDFVGVDVDEAGLDPISELARERREAAQTEIESSPPDFVLGVSRTEAMYTIEPRMLPLPQISFEQLEARLHAAYGVTLRPPNFAPLLSIMSREELASMPPDDLIQRLLRLPDTVLEFESGRFPTSKYDFVPINTIRIDRESVFVGVRGHGRVAELIASEVAEAIWSAAGASKRWSEIEPAVQLISFATGTKVDLGVPFSAILAPAVLDLTKQMTDTSGTEPPLAFHLGPQHGPAYTKIREYSTDSRIYISTLDNVSIKVSSFDTITGQKFEPGVTLSVRARGEQGTSIVEIVSEMSYDRHLELVAALRSSLLL